MLFYLGAKYQSLQTHLNFESEEIELTKGDYFRSEYKPFCVAKIQFDVA